MVALAEIMTSDVFTASPDTAVTDGAAAMVRRRFGSAVVLEGGAVSGIFTERDVLRAAASGAELTQSPVSRWMTPDPVTAGPEVDSDQAAELMLGGGFRHLPVVEGGKLAGIVSLRDLLSVRISRRGAAVAQPRGRGRRLWPPGRRPRN
jgi:CBS domain-containing protein